MSSGCAAPWHACAGPVVCHKVHQQAGGLLGLHEQPAGFMFAGCGARRPAGDRLCNTVVLSDCSELAGQTQKVGGGSTFTCFAMLRDLECCHTFSTESLRT
jgi:hypothetical protein